MDRCGLRWALLPDSLAVGSHRGSVRSRGRHEGAVTRPPSQGEPVRRRRGSARCRLGWTEDGRDGDGPVLPDPPARIPEDGQFGIVTAYATRRGHVAAIERRATAIVPIRGNGRPWKEGRPVSRSRDDASRATRHRGRAFRKRRTGCHARSRTEARMRCLRASGERIAARDPDRQAAEALPHRTQHPLPGTRSRRDRARGPKPPGEGMAMPRARSCNGAAQVRTRAGRTNKEHGTFLVNYRILLEQWPKRMVRPSSGGRLFARNDGEATRSSKS